MIPAARVLAIFAHADRHEAEGFLDNDVSTLLDVVAALGRACGSTHCPECEGPENMLDGYDHADGCVVAAAMVRATNNESAEDEG